MKDGTGICISGSKCSWAKLDSCLSLNLFLQLFLGFCELINPPFNSASSNWISVTWNQKSPIWYHSPLPNTCFQHLKDIYLATHLFCAPNINYLIWLNNQLLVGQRKYRWQWKNFPALLSYRLLTPRRDFQAGRRIVKRPGDITQRHLDEALPLH